MLNRERVENNIRKWSPLIVAILSAILNFFSFLIGINWRADALFWVSFLSIICTIIFSSAIVYFFYKISLPTNDIGIDIISTSDIYQIKSHESTIYKKIINLRMCKKLPYLTYFPPDIDGSFKNIKAYFIDNPHNILDISVCKPFGKKGYYVNFGREYREGEKINGLCIEHELINAFKSVHEGVGVRTEYKQEKCQLIININSKCFGNISNVEWFLAFQNNLDPEKNGSLNVNKNEEGYYILEYDFSFLLDKNMTQRCAISWNWDIYNT